MIFPTNPGCITWAENLFDSLQEGGVWCCPRTALIYQKRKGVMTLTGRMPYHPSLPYTEGEWKELQDDDIAGNKEMFKAAGIEVGEAVETTH
jgi:hypothetical protein